jgi:hypothetical protein
VRDARASRQPCADDAGGQHEVAVDEIEAAACEQARAAPRSRRQVRCQRQQARIRGTPAPEDRHANNPHTVLLDLRGSSGVRDVSTVTSWRAASDFASMAIAMPPPPPSGGYSKLHIRSFMRGR